MISLGQIVERIGGELNGDPECIISGAAPLDEAVEGQICFADKKSLLKHLSVSKAAAVIVPKGFTHPDVNLIQADNPRLAFAQVLNLLYPMPESSDCRHPSAVIGENCTIGKDVMISAGVVLGDNVAVGHRVKLHANVVIGDHVVVGDDSVIYPNVCIREGSRIGNRVIIHSGSVIGSDGCPA